MPDSAVQERSARPRPERRHSPFSTADGGGRRRVAAGSGGQQGTLCAFDSAACDVVNCTLYAFAFED